MTTPQHKRNPFIPRPARKEHPVEEDLVQSPPPAPHLAEIPVAFKQDVPILLPNYNTLYDSLRSREGWRYIADGYADGTVTTIAATAVVATVNLTLPSNTQSPNWRLEQWPGGTQLFLVIRSFSLGPSTATFATQGEINVVYISKYGNPVPLGIFPNNNFVNIFPLALIPAPHTDSGDQTALGSLSFTLNAGATVGAYAWQIGFSAAYLLPAIKGYNIERISDARYHHILHDRDHSH
jgi:hypothetical protein